MDMKYVASVSLLAFASTGHAVAQAGDLPRPPTATEFQATIPEHGHFSTSRTVKGHDAVTQLRKEAGLDVADLARFDVADPLLTDSASLEATIRHGGSTARSQARASAASAAPHRTRPETPSPRRGPQTDGATPVPMRGTARNGS